jgi:ABC-type uncharacterized transport system substrate-binding protein
VDNFVVAALALATAAVVLLLATIVLGLMSQKRMSEIHVLVNNKHDKLDARIDQLTAALTEAGVAIPAREDLPGGFDT